MKDLKSIWWLLRQTGKQFWRILALTVSRVLLALLGVAFAILTSLVLDSALSGRMQQLVVPAIWLCAVGAAEIVLVFLNRHLTVDITAGIDIRLKKLLFSSILRTDFMSVRKYHSGMLLSRMQDDVKIVADGLTEILPGFFSMSVQLVAAFCAVCFIDIRFALCFLALGICAMGGAVLLRGKMKRLHRVERETGEQTAAFTQEGLENLLVVKAFGAEVEMQRRRDALETNRLVAIRRRKRYGAFLSLLMNSVFHGGLIFGLIWCGVRISRGLITAGVFSAMLQLIGQLQRPLTTLSGYVPLLASLLASAERLRDLLQLPREDCGCIAPEGMQEICGENIAFSYDREPVLQNADFSLRQGEFAALCGVSGMGKSTLMKLLMGIYAPDGGKLYVRTEKGNVPLDSRTRALFAYVPQGNFLTSGTIRDNICLMAPDAEERELWAALEISCADGFVRELPLGLDETVGERGAGLSEGQLQRLAIARAILSGAPVLLLDESTSALDESTEKQILQNLRRMTDKTCLIISHRKAALEICDRVLMLQDGKIETV